MPAALLSCTMICLLLYTHETFMHIFLAQCISVTCITKQMYPHVPNKCKGAILGFKPKVNYESCALCDCSYRQTLTSKRRQDHIMLIYSDGNLDV